MASRKLAIPGLNRSKSCSSAPVSGTLRPRRQSRREIFLQTEQLAIRLEERIDTGQLPGALDAAVP